MDTNQIQHFFNAMINDDLEEFPNLEESLFDNIRHIGETISVTDYSIERLDWMVIVTCTWYIGDDIMIKFWYNGDKGGNQDFYISVTDEEDNTVTKITNYLESYDVSMVVSEDILDMLNIPRKEGLTLLTIMNRLSFLGMF